MIEKFRNWEKDNVGISNNVWINKKRNIVYKKYDKNEFSLLFGNQEKEILSLIGDFKIIKSNKNRIIMNYIDGNPINSNDLDNVLLKKIAEKIFKIHKIDIKKSPDLYIPKYQDVWFLLRKNDKIPKVSNEDFYFSGAMKLLNKNLAVCSNDITDGNILIDKNNDVIIIDYEYGGINNYLFDLAGFVVKRQISKIQEDIFINEYFKLKEIPFPKEEFDIIRKFVSYFWSKWAYYKYLQTNDKIYFDIYKWLIKR